MDANQLALNILAFFSENLAIISHDETSRTWERAFKRISPVLEEKILIMDKPATEKSQKLNSFPVLITEENYQS